MKLVEGNALKIDKVDLHGEIVGKKEVGSSTINNSGVVNIGTSGKQEEDLDEKIKTYIDRRVDEKFEEIKTNFVPRTAKPELSIIQYANANCVCLHVLNSGCLDAENVSIKVPEDEIECLLNNGWDDDIDSIRKCFEIDHVTLHSGEQCELAKYDKDCLEPKLKQRPRLFLVTYSYQRGEETVHPPQEKLLVRIGTFTFS